MNKNIKTCHIVITLLVVAMCLSFICSCSDPVSDPDRITEIYFVSFTGFNNSLYMNEDELGDKWRSCLEQKEAVELAHEVEAIPDTVTTEGEHSYIIRINYVENGVEKSVEKEGYDTFPDNWGRIIELTNIVAGGYDSVTNSTELAVVNAAYLRKGFPNLDESIIPEDLALEDMIEDIPITYLTLYEPDTYIIDSDVTQMIKDYLYDYLGLRDHQIEEIDNNPAKSTTDEMKEFASSRLDEVSWDYATDYSCSGWYNGEEYTIIRYEKVESWLADESQYYDKCGFDGPHCQYRTDYEWEEQGHCYSEKDVFVDGSGKFLILTNCQKPSDIIAVVE